MTSSVSVLRTTRRKPSRDYRLWAVVGIVAAIAALGTLIQKIPARGVVAEDVVAAGKNMPRGFDTLREGSAPTNAKDEMEVLAEPASKPDRPISERERANAAIKNAAQLIRSKRHEDAIQALHTEHAALKNDPRAYYYLAKALLARGDPASSRDFYQKSIDLDPGMADAYFGFAEASEAQGDLEAALGGMRTFIHVSQNADPYRLRIARARSAIWEWEAQLGRGPWGPTRGIPPGFTAEEIKRDGRGVGIKMQKVETLRPDGTMDAEVKGQSKFKIFKNE